MILNNAIVIWGLWAMLFDGKPDQRELTVYFLILNGVLTTAWGSVCFLFGGFHALGKHVEDGSLEPMLSTPRHPLLLVGLSESLLPALGDVIQGVLNMAVLFFLAPVEQAIRCVVFTGICATAVVGLFVATGSIPFFVKRGNGLAYLLREICLSLSFYPTGKVFTGQARIVLYLTPAALLGVLPVSAIESGSWRLATASALGAFSFLWLSIRIFQTGLRRYQTTNYVTARS